MNGFRAIAVATLVFAIRPSTADAGAWRFKHKDRPVKVVVLAGSVGAFPKGPYARRLQAMCRNVEVKNLSKTNLGAGGLKKRFKSEVLKNPRVRPRRSEFEHWLVYQAGVNSLGLPTLMNRQIRNLFLQAHRGGFLVAALTPAPWGALTDKRWRGASALRRFANTKLVRAFILGQVSPREALGEDIDPRTGGENQRWRPWELADIAVDVYDSQLRDPDAALRDADEAARELDKDRAWRKLLAKVPKAERKAKRAAAIESIRQMPRWFMRPEFHSFDHIHPNTEGHRILAETMCPQLPASWGCECPGAQAERE